MTIGTGRPGLTRSAILLAVGLGLSGCRRDPASPPGESLRRRVLVAATIYPIADAVSRVGGRHVEVLLLVPPGESPLAYRPSATTAKQLAGAKLLVAVGAGLDDWTDDLFVAAGKGAPPVLNLTAGPGDDASGDGFTWLDPIEMVRITGAIDKRLREIDPPGAADYANNGARYQAELRELDKRIAESLDPVRGKPFHVLSPAFSRFAARYELRHSVLPHAYPGPLSPRRADELVAAMKQQEVRFFFADLAFPIGRLEAIAKQTGARFDRLDPYGSPDIVGHDSYVAVMKTNAASIVQGLSD